MEPVDLSVLVDEVIDIQRVQAMTRLIGLTGTVERLPKGLQGDATRIRQALLNYVTNAIKFTTAGQVDIRVAMEKDDESSTLVRIEVRDTGIGIAEDEIPRLFRAFEQADSSMTRKYGGTGLGLAITRMVANKMGGDAGADSRLGEGSTFWFTVRRAKSQVMAEATGRRSEDFSDEDMAACLSGRSVLLVEYEPVDREVASLILGQAELLVTAVAGGVDALQLLDRRLFNVVIMDVQLPGMDGLTATRFIRARPGLRRLPIVAMTANAFAEVQAKCLDAGMNAFVAKPVDPRTLCATLCRLLAKPEALVADRPGY
jgi:CheY-like chemotaxis protein